MSLQLAGFIKDKVYFQLPTTTNIKYLLSLVSDRMIITD